jgi:type VI secretion system secreted protein VgrG
VNEDMEFSGYEAMPEGSGTSYRCSFVAMSSQQQFRPRRSTPRPFVQGPQTAVVVGPAGDEIHTDELGRVKVQFHWDRLGRQDENSSCFIRVSHYWAGKGWGAVHTPRIGHEVIVDFLEGDPDQPIIVGRVYNAVNMPPYTLPEHKTQSGVKSRSSLAGTPENFNEIRFEDKKGSEHVVVHAERNLNILAKANERRTIGANSTTTVGNNSTVTVGTDPKGDPKKNGKVTTTIFGDTSTTITKGDLSLDVQTGKMTVHVKGIVDQTFDDTSKVTVANEMKFICGASSITMKKDGTIEIVGKDIKINGSSSVAVDSAKIDSVATAGHKLKGADVKINGSASVAVDSAKIDSVATGVHTIKGAMVKINS